MAPTAMNPPPLRKIYRRFGTARLVGAHPPPPGPLAEPKKKKPKDYLAIEEENEWRL